MGAEVGLCTSSWERLETCYAGLTQRRMSIAGAAYAWRAKQEEDTE